MSMCHVNVTTGARHGGGNLYESGVWCAWCTCVGREFVAILVFHSLVRIRNPSITDMTDTELTKVHDEAAEADLNLSKYVIDLENCGHLEVYVQGDLETGKNGDAVFMTIHGVGNSYKTWARFMNHEDMLDTKNR